jgi:hypothetical protein
LRLRVWPRRVLRLRRLPVQREPQVQQVPQVQPVLPGQVALQVAARVVPDLVQPARTAVHILTQTGNRTSLSGLVQELRRRRQLALRLVPLPAYPQVKVMTVGMHMGMCFDRVISPGSS